MEKITGTAEKLVVFLMGQDRSKIWELAPRKIKRSLSQNAYYWQLLGKTADALRMSKPELHNRMLRDFGQVAWIDGQTVSVELPDTDKAEKTALRSETYHLKPTGQVIEKAGKTYRTYVLLRGSSDYNTWEMSVLLDGMIQEAQGQGIETLTPTELEAMRDYEKHHKK